VGLLVGDEQLVVEAVGVEVPPRGQPVLPAVAALQRLNGLARLLAVGLALLLAALVADVSLGDLLVGVPPDAGPIPASPHAWTRGIVGGGRS
jgi:hypothetical protein